MHNLEETYNKAAEMLKAGHSKEAVLLEFPESREELSPLLDINSLLLSLPKNQAPQPAMQRKYSLAPSKNFWLTWIHISKFVGASMSIMLLLSAFTVAGYGTWKSAPGQALFQVKKLAEKSQALILARSPDQKAVFQINITQKRLDEARQIFNNPQNSPDKVAQEKAALSELTDQTNNAVSAVNAVAKNNPNLLNSLASITKQQQNLLADIKDSQVQTAANSALKSLSSNQTKIDQIKQSVATASSDQALAKLNADPNEITVSGEISQTEAGQITVEKTVFSVSPQTVIKNISGKILSLSDLKLKTKISITGLKTQNNLVAQQIIITEPADSGEVKGSSTQIANQTVPQNATPTSASLKKADEQNSSTQADPGTALGSFILEDPTPQFVQ